MAHAYHGDTRTQVSMASHSVTWAVEQLILPFLQLGWRRASAAYTAASMRALVAALDVEPQTQTQAQTKPKPKPKPKP